MINYFVILQSSIVTIFNISQPLTYWLCSFFQLRSLTFEELQERMLTLDSDMEREIEELRKRYQTKRHPIIEAMEVKKRRQTNF